MEGIISCTLTGINVMPYQHPTQPMRVGFISTRVSGSDGVSLEIAKWATVLERMGHICYYIAGQCDRPDDRSILIPEAHFRHPVISQPGF
jgi:hypothetical protein